jgi:hypothetical protein
MCEDSYDQWRDAVQANKSIFDAATKSLSGSTMYWLAETLNTTGAEEVKAIAASPTGKAITFILRNQKAARNSKFNDVVINLRCTCQKAEVPRAGSDREAEFGAQIFNTGRDVSLTLRNRPDYTGAGDEGEDILNTEYLDVEAEEVAEEYDDYHNEERPNDDKPDTEFFNTTQMTQGWRQYWEDIPADEQEKLDQDMMYAVYVLTLPDQFKNYYVPADIQGNDLHLERALQLLHRRRFGIAETSLRIRPHINYSFLDETLGTGIRDKMLRERTENEKAGIEKAFGTEFLETQVDDT